MKNKRTTTKRLLLVLFIVYGQVGFAQNFTYKSKINSIAKNAFYKVLLSSELSAHSSNHLEDLRIIDNKGKEIPYLLTKESSYGSKSNFIQYTILENKNDNQWQTIIIENPNKDKINKFILEMKNSDANRILQMSGSNDKKKWFVVRDNFYFTSYNNENTSNIQKEIAFPSSDYFYYKIDIKNKDKNPINILSVGHYTNTIQIPSFLTISGLSYKIRTSNKKTYITCVCSPANRIDRLKFYISSPTMYKRLGKITNNTENEKIKEDYTIRPLGSSSKLYKRSPESLPSTDFEFNSEVKAIIQTENILSNNKTDSFTIEINNQDNEALQIDSISAFQLTTTLTASLDKDKSYFLYFGDSLLQSPNYDLPYFQNKISTEIDAITIGPVVPKESKIADEYTNDNSVLYVWIGLAIIALILIYLTTNMLKKMKTE